MNYLLSVRINLDKNKQSFICGLFLVYFVCYAISPLSLTCTAKQVVDEQYTANGAVTSCTGLRIFLLEIICAGIDEKKTADQDNSTVRVLIRKARGIMPENVYARFFPLGNFVLYHDISLFSYHSSSRLLASSDKQETFCEFNPLHSGPAPPSV